jgi:hypothetical protein
MNKAEGRRQRAEGRGQRAEVTPYIPYINVGVSKNLN